MNKVSERALTIATFRAVAVRLMEMAAAWTPTTPEMEAKVMLGRHIWDFARHADALGKRTFELRLPEQASRPPADAYATLLADVAATRDTPRRLAALYDVVVPGLERRLAAYVADTDPVLDGPSVVVIEQILTDLARQRREADALRRALSVAATSTDDLRRRDASIPVVAHAGGH